MLWGEARHVVVHGDEASPVGSISALDSDGACVVADGDARVNGGVCGSVDAVDNPDSFHIAVAGDEDGSSGLCGLPGRIVWVPSGYPASFAFGCEVVDSFTCRNGQFEPAGGCASHHGVVPSIGGRTTPVLGIMHQPIGSP
jgi:hypothetical protein